MRRAGNYVKRKPDNIERGKSIRRRRRREEERKELYGLAVLIETIYLMLKLRGKEPFITDKYAVIILIRKIIWAAFFIIAALFFFRSGC